MTMFRFGLSVLALTALAACSNAGVNTSPIAPMALAPAAATATALKSTDITQFIDPGALTVMSDKDRTEAASAQFYALQFGRPGAPRQWQGDDGNSGQINVGPYVRVNDRDCREFTHKVATGSGNFSKSGMACRLEGGTWESASDS